MYIERINKMLKYENIATIVISVNLHNNYSIVSFANWDKENNAYEVTLYLKRNDVDLLELIEKQENVVFDSDSKSIRTDMARYITDLFKEGHFDYYINRFEFEQKCSNKGFEFYEEERLNNGIE